MNKRIEEVRKSLSLSRAAFGERIGVSGDVINNLERGRVEAKEHMILLICREFSVNEHWLRTGEGEMFLPMDKETELAKLTVDLLTESSDSFKSRFISLLARMSDDEWEMLENLVEKLTKKE